MAERDAFAALADDTHCKRVGFRSKSSYRRCQMPLDLPTILAAHERIRRHLHLTPVLTSETVNRMLDAELFFKCENFQKTGSFKARGATHAVLSLSDAQAAAGVVTHSSGNHAAAVARAAAIRGIPAHIVMPLGSSAFKVRRTEDYGATITFCEPTHAARELACKRILDATGGALIHPFIDERVMAGQGTAAIELMNEVQTLDMIMCPVGGGGLLAGTAVAAKAIQPSIRVVAAEPLGADDAARSVAMGRLVSNVHPSTIADGLRADLGAPNFEILRRHVDAVITVEESSIVAAMRLIWETMKIVIEPSAAVTVAALLERKVPDATRARIGIILTGGNVDLDHLPWMNRQAAVT